MTDTKETVKDMEQAEAVEETVEETVEEVSAEEVTVEETEEAAEAAEEKESKQVADLMDKLMRSMAEFDNFRKRTEKEKSQMFDNGMSAMIGRILPVVDDFERGINAMTDEEKESTLGKGMEMIYKKLAKVLEDSGVTPIEAVGQPFDPNFHNAVMQAESDEQESGTVLNEFQKGYMYKGSVLRHSMVSVVQ